MPLDRVWFLFSLSYTGYTISHKSVINNVHDLCESVIIINRMLGPKRGTEIEIVVLNSVCILKNFLSSTGSGFQTLSGSPIPKYWLSTPPGGKILTSNMALKQQDKTR